MAKVQPIPSDSNFQDLTGRWCGHRFVVGYAGRGKCGARWFCICRCGTSSTVDGRDLLRNRAHSCGCQDGLTVRERLLSRRTIDSVTGCWRWTGHTDEDDYGVIKVNQVNNRVHRMSYEAFVGPIPAGMFVCHHCDTPRCFCPAHLFLGTIDDNSADMVRKNRHAKGERMPFSKLTEKDVTAIRRMASSGYTNKTIAEQFPVNSLTVSRVVRRLTWKHVD